MFPGDLRHLLEWKDSQVGVAQGFAKYNLGIRSDCLFKILRVCGVNQRDFDSVLGQGVCELVKGSTIQPAGGNDVVTGTAQCENRLRLCSMTRTCSQRRHAAFE